MISAVQRVVADVASGRVSACESDWDGDASEGSRSDLVADSGEEDDEHEPHNDSTFGHQSTDEGIRELRTPRSFSHLSSRHSGASPVALPVLKPRATAYVTSPAHRSEVNRQSCKRTRQNRNSDAPTDATKRLCITRAVDVARKAADRHLNALLERVRARGGCDCSSGPDLVDTL